MSFERTVDELRKLVGSRACAVIMDEQYDRADGWIGHFGGTLSRIEDPVPELHDPVHFVRFGDDDAAFAVHRALFRGAEWTTDAGAPALRIELANVAVWVYPSD